MKSIISPLFFASMLKAHDLIVRSDRDPESIQPWSISTAALEKLFHDPEILDYLNSDHSENPMGLEDKRELLQKVSERVSDIGLVYIVRDILSTYFADDERSRFYEGTLLIAGIGAYVLKRLSEESEPETGTSQLFQDASDIIGIGAGVASFSLDLQSLVEGSKCIVGVSWKDDCVDDREDLILDTVGSGVSVIADVIGFIIPSVGFYTAVMEILWILSSEAYRSTVDRSKMS